MELGWGSEPSKEVSPRDRLDALEVNVDLQGERLRLTEAKRERCGMRRMRMRWLEVSCVIV